MDVKRQPGIKVIKITLKNSLFIIDDKYYDIKEKPDPIIHFIHNKNKVLGLLDFGIQFLYKKDEQELLKSEVIFRGKFEYEDGEKSNMDIEHFLNHNAPAIIYPFVRSHLADLSMKAGIPVIMLPILNLPAIMEKFIKEQQKEATKQLKEQEQEKKQKLNIE